jgi:Na+-translocating ferredoxin:NAD+ oxidoreductase subunit B
MSYAITDTCSGCLACTKICPVSAISGEKKMIHTIDPSACIECGACGRICPKGAVLDSTGRKCNMLKRSLWMKPEINKALCMSCAVCIDSCPVNCLNMGESGKAGDLHPYPFLQKEKECLGCGICATDCPVDAIRMSL